MLTAKCLPQFSGFFAYLIPFSDIESLEQKIIRFPGRIKREKWVEQAQALASGK